ncbi:hypothetical protein IWZ00DRAFT_485051 [Phyllosticta capitalensis]
MFPAKRIPPASSARKEFSAAKSSPREKSLPEIKQGTHLASAALCGQGFLPSDVLATVRSDGEDVVLDPQLLRAQPLLNLSVLSKKWSEWGERILIPREAPVIWHSRQFVLGRDPRLVIVQLCRRDVSERGEQGAFERLQIRVWKDPKSGGKHYLPQHSKYRIPSREVAESPIEQRPSERDEKDLFDGEMLLAGTPEQIKSGKQAKVKKRATNPEKAKERAAKKTRTTQDDVTEDSIRAQIWPSTQRDGRSRKRACGEGRQRPRTYEKCNALDIKRNSPDQPLDKMTHAAHSAYIKKQKHGEKVSWDYWLAWPSFCHLCGTRRSSDDELFKHLRRDEHLWQCAPGHNPVTLNIASGDAEKAKVKILAQDGDAYEDDDFPVSGLDGELSKSDEQSRNAEDENENNQDEVQALLRPTPPRPTPPASSDPLDTHPHQNNRNETPETPRKRSAEDDGRGEDGQKKKCVLSAGRQTLAGGAFWGELRQSLSEKLNDEDDLVQPMANHLSSGGVSILSSERVVRRKNMRRSKTGHGIFRFLRWLAGLGACRLCGTKRSVGVGLVDHL